MHRPGFPKQRHGRIVPRQHRAVSSPPTNNMCRFLEFGNKSIQKKCNHSSDTVATKQDTAMRDFFVNYEHARISAAFRRD
jgi:hypothetical protein